jgi:predicted metal-dependent hydrolase
MKRLPASNSDERREETRGPELVRRERIRKRWGVYKHKKQIRFELMVVGLREEMRRGLREIVD